jgi:AbrB family looped-hinge helix DNA binding protein
MAFEVTKVGERGQIVIPKEFREEMHINKGEKFIVLRKGDSLILKRLVAPSKKQVNDMFKRATEHAKKHGLTDQDMWDSIKKARSQK